MKPNSVAIHLSHVAVLVRSVDHAAEVLSNRGFAIGPAESWEGEGTKEIYVERKRANSILLMEPICAGPYQRAMEKRGPGFHHFAIGVANLDEFIVSLSGSGWLLHPMSIRLMKAARTAYLARPGFPALIEVQEKREGHEGHEERAPFVTRVEFEFSGLFAGLLQAVGLSEIVSPTLKAPCIHCADTVVPLSELTGTGSRAGGAKGFADAPPPTGEATTLFGRCFCGQVRFSVRPPIQTCTHCHCESCRRAHSSAFVTWSSYRKDQLKILEGSAHLTQFESSRNVYRRFCKWCGSHLFFQCIAEDPVLYSPTACFYGPVGVTPTRHVSFEERVAWLTLGDHLPKYEGKTQPINCALEP
ncbi:MAG: GFA family protein [Bdellovibrionales bacterium]